MIEIHADGACKDNPGPGGWAAIILPTGKDGQRKVIRGREENTTNNRMELTAVIKGLEQTPVGSEVVVYSDSQYLINTMSRGWKRKKNNDLWESLGHLSSSRAVRWEWERGHAGDPLNEEVDRLAKEQAGIVKSRRGNSEVTNAESGTDDLRQGKQLTHLDAQGRARMVDITQKADTQREAVAKGYVTMESSTLHLIKEGKVAKGDVLSVARLAGVMAAKSTPHLIPLCHPLLLTDIEVELQLNQESNTVDITATVRTTGKTGVEMEALTAVSVAALTIYDMCKAADRRMRIEGIRLARKSGGKSGLIKLED